MAIAIDGTPVTHRSSGGGQTTAACAGVTVTPGDVMLCLVGSVNQVTGVTGTVSGTFTKLGDVNGSAAGWGSIWYVVTGASSATTETITASQVSGSFIEAVAFGVSGAKTSAPWDPLTGSSFLTQPTNNGALISLTTTVTADEMIFGILVDTSGAGPYTAGTGFTLVSTTFVDGTVEYRIVSATGTYTVTRGSQTGPNTQCQIAAAMVEAPPTGAPTLNAQIWM